jgi:hypothetical protein
MAPSKRAIAFPGKTESVGGHLDGSNGIDEYEAGRPTQHVMSIREKVLVDGAVELMPYSLTRIELRLAE